MQKLDRLPTGNWMSRWSSVLRKKC